MNKRVAIYCKEMLKDVSIEEQKIKLLGHCKEQGYQVVKIYEDKLQDGKGRIKEVIDDSKKDIFTTVVFLKMSHIASDITEICKFSEVLGDRGIAIRSITEGMETETTTGRFTISIMQEVDNFYKSLER
ncbi:MAG: recombinase family protein [Romboutsia sp.]